MSRRIRNRFILSGLAFASFFAGNPRSAELLHMDFNDSANLGSQPGTLPLGIPAGDTKPSSGYPGAVEFGPAGGSIRVPGFHSPTGPFTVEARFRIHAYGPEASNFIANILNTVPDVHQGLAFRVGGGYLYPPLPRNAYKTESEWSAAQAGFSPVSRERISDCFPVFVMAGSLGSWKEVYSDRCVAKDEWTHFVGTWDGADMRIYLNGSDATDSWRTQGPEATPFLGGEVDAYVGARTNADFDPRHLEGAIDFVKVEEGAISENEIHKRYKDSFVPEDRDSLCRGVVIPKYPEAGQLCEGKVDFEFKIINHGACTDTSFLASFLAGDSVEVEISKDAAFADVVLRTVVTVTSLHLDPDSIPALADYHGALYWRVRLIHAKPAALAKASASTPDEWSLSRPLVLDMPAVGLMRPRAPSLRPVLFRSGSGFFVAGTASSAAPVLFNLAGKRQASRFHRVAGGWRMDPAQDGPCGLFFLEMRPK
ncbi:MAG: LamG domain-containing protein [Fibrobacteres bacterium]|jgi:hypothetical protein|nr:LamG domain-containing protein [Fibrobacterota bacterium]